MLCTVTKHRYSKTIDVVVVDDDNDDWLTDWLTDMEMLTEIERDRQRQI